jgi:hypothetical protein
MNWVFGVIIGVLIFLFLVFFITASNGSNGQGMFSSGNPINSVAASSLVTSPQGDAGVNLLGSGANAINAVNAMNVNLLGNVAANAAGSVVNAAIVNNALNAANVVNVVNTGNAGNPVPDQEVKSFNQLYVEFGNNAMGYLSGETEKSVLVESIDSLSNVLCSNEKELVASLYLKKIEILQKLVVLYKKSNDISMVSPEITAIKKKVREYSDKLAKKMTGCLNVKFSEIRYFYTLSDSIIIKYAVVEDLQERQRVKSIFSDVVSKMMLN